MVYKHEAARQQRTAALTPSPPRHSKSYLLKERAMLEVMQKDGSKSRRGWRRKPQMEPQMSPDGA